MCQDAESGYIAIWVYPYTADLIQLDKTINTKEETQGVYQRLLF